MLNLVDASSLGQIALEAKSLGVDALVFHKPLESTTEMEFLEDWEMVRGNTDLPIYVSGPINRDNIHQVLQLSPDGIIIENAIIHAENPAEEAEYFHKLINQ
jgi:3-keto-L-gulonate-6-phosphate decarboxylase